MKDAENKANKEMAEYWKLFEEKLEKFEKEFAEANK